MGNIKQLSTYEELILSDEELAKIRTSFAKMAAKSKDDVRDDTTETKVIAITRKK